MPLHLRIDNMDSLPDGGPVSFELDRRGIDVGRDPYLDWTLPDPERYISGKHCEIRYRDGGYWLHDVSTNGTTVNGRPGRLTEPYRLQDGDRIQIGQYIIGVELKGEDAAPSPVATGSPAGGNPWDDVPDAAAAVDRREFAARARAGSVAAPHGPADLPEEDISWSMGEVTQGASPPPDPWSAPPADQQPDGTSDNWGWAPSPAPESPATAPDRKPAAVSADAARLARPDPFAVSPAPMPVRTTRPDAEASRGAAEPGGESNPPVAGASGAGSAQEPAPLAVHEPAQAASGLAGQWGMGAASQAPQTAAERPADSAPDFIAAFERGAGLPPGAVAERTDDAFAEELGTLFRLVAQNLQAMLLARAETKSAMRSAERTMINAFENNPLKFSPTPEDALRIMFGAKSRSYLDARATLESSFGDLQRHQLQTFGAMQQALQALIEDLDPKNIEEATSEDSALSALVGSRRAKFWDTYVERFRAKSARHERGMIDAFMILFAEMYDRQR